MSLLLNLFGFLWFAGTLRSALFWLYLWQLKEYHIPRFVDHFRTHQGKMIFSNQLFAVKLVLLILWMGYPQIAFWLLGCLYLAQAAWAVRQFVLRKTKLPVATFKTILLFGIIGAFMAGYLWLALWLSPDGQALALWLLLFDLACGLVVSAAVLAAQPFFVLGRKRILENARRKIAAHADLKVVAITGSYGKTSTKEFLTTILKGKYRVLSTSLHQNSEMGIARCILNELEDSHQIFVVEMGSYVKGGIRLLCDIVRPQMGIVTGVNGQHLALFGSWGNLLSAEGGGELLEALPGDGLLIVNGDNHHCLDLYRRAAIKKKLYSVSGKMVAADMFASEVSVEPAGLSFVAVASDGETVPVTAPLLGRQQVQNLLGAMLAAKELGMAMSDIALAAAAIRQAQGGMTRQRGACGIEVIDASYSSNPDGVMADLDYLACYPGKKAVVMPCLIELGKESARVHEEIGKKIGQVCDIAIITTRDQFEAIRSGAETQQMPSDNLLLCDNPREIFQTLTTALGSGDAVLLEGRVPQALISELMQPGI